MKPTLHDELFLDYINMDQTIKNLSQQRYVIQCRLIKKNICVICQTKYAKNEMKITPKGAAQLVYQCPKKHFLIISKFLDGD